MWLNRTICSVLEEIRDAHKEHNYSYLLSLIEEVQSLANRMESALEDKCDIESLRDERSKLNKEIKKLKNEKEECNG